MNMTYGYASVFFSVIIGLSLFNLAHSKIIQFVFSFSLITHRFYVLSLLLLLLMFFTDSIGFFYVCFSCYCRLHYVLVFFVLNSQCLLIRYDIFFGGMAIVGFFEILFFHFVHCLLDLVLEFKL